MNDQAAMLRQMMAQRGAPERRPDPTTPTLVVGSGKGGVGKSVVSVLIASALAAKRRKVLLVEGDQDLGNLHVLLGTRPVGRLDGLLHSDASPSDLLCAVADGLWLLPGDSGSEALYGATSIDRARLHHRVASLFPDFDAVVVDTGAGIESVVRACTIAATSLVMVTMPEPAALTDAYAVIKIANLQLPSVPVDVIVNRVSDDPEAKLAFDKLQTGSRRFLRRSLEHLGAIPEDPRLTAAVRAGANLLHTGPETPAGRAAAAIATRWWTLRSAPHNTATMAGRS